MAYQLCVAVVVLVLAKQSSQECRCPDSSKMYCTSLNQSTVSLDFAKVCYRYRYDEILHFGALWADNSSIHVLPTNFTERFDFKIMVLEGIQLNRITPGAFDNQRQRVEELYLKSNHLRKINTGIFNMLSLKILDLQHNEIEEIEENSFSSLRSLRKILLNYNKLSKLPYSVFDPLRNLEYLDLSHNFLGTLDKSIFVGNINLQVLYLNNNNLSSIPENVFTNNKNLTVLDISYNPIKHIEYNIFQNLQHLHDLDVSFTENNSMFHLDKSFIARITKLSLDGKNITEIGSLNENITSLSLSANNLIYINNTLFKPYVYLTYLNLSRNSIRDFERTAFFSLTSLKTLDLSKNKIQFLPHGLFANLVCLEYLDISSNSIEVLPYGSFDSLQNLTYLDVSSNEISSIAALSLHSLRNLKEFHLDNNNIEFLDGIELTSQLNALETISFDNNLWICPKLIKLVHILENKKVRVIYGNHSHSHNINKIKCEDVTFSDNYGRSNNDTIIDYVKIKERFDNIFSNIMNKFYSSDFYNFFNKDFKDTEFYNFFKNAAFYKMEKSITANANNTVNSPTAYKFVANEKPQNATHSLEIVLYLLCVALFLNVALTVYQVFVKKHFKMKAVRNNDIVESTTELV